MEINNEFLNSLFEKAYESFRLRQSYDLRTGPEDNSQRMLNALLPRTNVPIHRHPMSTENVICLCGRLEEVLYDDNGNEIARYHLCPAEGYYGCQVPKGVWHTVEVWERSVIYEAKDGKYGKDGSEDFDSWKKNNNTSFESFNNSPNDLKKNIEYLIGMEHQSGSMEVITPLYVSRMLHVPLKEVEKQMQDMGLV